MNKRYVLDANSIVSFLENEPGAARMEQLFQELRHGSPALISVVNWGEVFYLSWQKYGEEPARRTLTNLTQLPLEIIAADQPLVLQAAAIKALHKIPYLDCMAAALAAQQNATLVTSDRDFEKLGRQFPILWLDR